MISLDHATRLDALAHHTDPAIRRLRRAAIWFLAAGRANRAEVFLAWAEEPAA